MHVWALLQVVLAVAGMSPQQKTDEVVVTSVVRADGVRVFSGGGLTFADQEGGEVRAFVALPPARVAQAYASERDALADGARTRAALRSADVDLDFAPVLDMADGPLGSRQFARPELAVAFARGLGDAACVKHFPGLGSAAFSTDERPHVDARVRPSDLAPFRAAIRAGVQCVMVNHAFYGTRYRASLEPRTYRRLRALGFRGVAITDSLSLVHDAPVERWAPQAARAGADLLLFSSPAHAARARRALVPLARSGELDAHVARVLRLRLGLHGTLAP